MEDLELLAEAMEEKTDIKRELTRIAKSSRLKRKMITAATVCVMLIVAFALVWSNASKKSEAKAQAEIDAQKQEIEELKKTVDELTANPIVVNPVAPEIVLDMVSSEMGEIGDLATVEYLFTNAAKFTDAKKLFGWSLGITEKSFILQWNGRIMAGVKLEKVSFEVEDKRITVFVPKAEILSYEVYNDSVEVLDEKNNVFNPITVDDKVDFDSKTEDAMKERAVENGLLEKAQANAEDIIYRLLTANSELKDYSIVFVISG